MNKAMRRLASGFMAVVSVGGVLIGSTASASAMGKDGTLDADEFGLFYYAGRSGCVFDLYGEDRNFSDDTFKGSCTGSGFLVNDNTESYRNRDAYAWKVATDKDLDGNVGEIPSKYEGNASATFKNKISSSTYTLHP
ncbi:hypothetical protein [Streptomyces goshikiensis]|uniref:hypothetical protein n=1 Tax=Streptomyces goshikiensis TaxID=1942 RepID=UPI00339F0ECB